GFAYTAIDQIINHAGRLRHRTQGRLSCPMVLRTPCGAGIHAPEHHSESPEAMFAHIPGIRVVYPSSPAKAYGLLLASIANPDRARHRVGHGHADVTARGALHAECGARRRGGAKGPGVPVVRVFHLPDLGEGLQEAEIVEWHVKPGETVESDKPMVSVETDKAIVEVPAPFGGKVEKLFGAPGDKIHVGAPLVG